MKDREDVKEALLRMSSYCASAERCRSEIQNKLEKRELSQDDIDYVLSFLQKENFLNEERYARAYVNDKYKFSKWGKRKIAQGLYLKGISQEDIFTGLASIDEELYFDNLQSILKVKKRTIKAATDYELNQKLARFAMGRGFEYSDIVRFLSHLEDSY